MIKGVFCVTNQEKIKRLFELLSEQEAYARSIGKLNFDMLCCAPEEGMDQAAEDMAVLGKTYHSLTHAPEYENLILELHENSEGLTELQKKMIEQRFESYEKEKNISAEFAYEMDVAFNKAYGKWLQAKKAEDFSLYRDSFASIIEYTKKAIDLREKKPEGYYNACLDDYEKGGNEEQLDAFFGALKERILPLMNKILSEGKKIREDFLSRPCPIPQQEAFSRYLLEVEGLRKTATVLMTTEHPFTDHYGPNDVRVTTHYFEENFVSNIFSTLHEGGHALFMQNEPAEFYEGFVADHMSNAMHETISRFYENLIGRSKEFIHFVYPKFKELGGETFADVSEEELYEAVNISRPDLIRTEADELTYSIHVMIRYEIEKEFMNGNITVDEIPELWNKKYEEYLGVKVPNDSEGCLQDVHWTGSFGYFPSYALGNAYGVQILRTMEKDFDVFGAVKEGKLDLVLGWLKEKVFSIASVTTPDEWIRAITGEPLNPNYYLDYLEEKYRSLYQLA